VAIGSYSRVGSWEDSDSKEIAEEAEEEEEAIAGRRKIGLDVVASGWRKKTIKKVAWGKFIKAKGKVK
jgi:hypothetical protein